MKGGWAREMEGAWGVNGHYKCANGEVSLWEGAGRDCKASQWRRPGLHSFLVACWGCKSCFSWFLDEDDQGLVILECA